jgi:hypothetical protein
MPQIKLVEIKSAKLSGENIVSIKPLAGTADIPQHLADAHAEMVAANYSKSLEKTNLSKSEKNKSVIQMKDAAQKTYFKQLSDGSLEST